MAATITIRMPSKASIKTFRKRLSAPLKRQLVNAESRYLAAVRPKLQVALRESLTRSPAYASVSFGILRGEFGLIDGRGKMDVIIDFIVDNAIRVSKQIKLGKGNIDGQTAITFSINYSALTSLGEAFQLTEKDELLPWLAWLLQSGGNVVIDDYRVAKIGNRLGRSGLNYTMIEGGTYSPGDAGSRRLIGTADDNFITRAIADNLRLFRNIVSQEFKKSLQGIKIF